LPLILSFAVNCSSTHTQILLAVQLYFILAAVFYFSSFESHPQQVSLAQQVALNSPLSLCPSISLSLFPSLFTHCVTCAAICCRIMSSVRYLVPLFGPAQSKVSVSMSLIVSVSVTVCRLAKTVALCLCC